MKLLFLSACLLAATTESQCHDSSDDRQSEQQEHMLQEGTSAVGMPAIHNFRERRMMKDILELRDQEGITTYTYVWNEMQGKLVFLGESIGYGLPYATQFTNPQKFVGQGAVMAQADPNGLFSPAAAEGTWILLKDPHSDAVRPVYIEPRVVVSPFKLDAGKVQ